MKRVYLPAHLLIPFLHEKPIEFRFAESEQFQKGQLDVDISFDGSCIAHVRPAGAGDVQPADVYLTFSMLDMVCWDESNKVFRATFFPANRADFSNSMDLSASNLPPVLLTAARTIDAESPSSQIPPPA